MCAVLGHHKRSRLGRHQRPDGRRNRCRVNGQRPGARAICRQVIDGVVGIVDRAKGFPRMSLLPASWFFRPLSQAAGAGRLYQPVARRRLAAVRTVSPQAALQSPTTRATSAAFSWRIVSFCAASAALSLASTAFCAISRSMLACKIATDVLSPVASAGCSGTRRRDSVSCHRRV